jgi:hypothetical protein
VATPLVVRVARAMASTARRLRNIDLVPLGHGARRFERLVTRYIARGGAVLPRHVSNRVER